MVHKDRERGDSMGDTAYVHKLPDCQLPHEAPVKASYDAKTLMGPWANVCEEHFKSSTAGRLGTGYGQKLVEGSAPEKDRAEQVAEARAALESGDWDAFEDAVGDGDPIDFL